LTLKYREFWQLLDESLPMTRKIMRTLARRLRQAERWTTG
jgi:CRP-like cAMP-binding protein